MIHPSIHRGEPQKRPQREPEPSPREVTAAVSNDEAEIDPAELFDPEEFSIRRKLHPKP